MRPAGPSPLPATHPGAPRSLRRSLRPLGGPVRALTVRSDDDLAVVIAYRPTDGRQLWKLAVPPSPRSNPPAIDGMAATGGKVFVVDGDGLVAIDGATGHRLRSSSTPSGPRVIAGG